MRSCPSIVAGAAALCWSPHGPTTLGCAAQVAVMLAGLLPDPERSLSAMAVYQNSNALAFMVPLGLAIAVITRCAEPLPGLSACCLQLCRSACLGAS